MHTRPTSMPASMRAVFVLIDHDDGSASVAVWERCTVPEAKRAHSRLARMMHVMNEDSSQIDARLPYPIPFTPECVFNFGAL